jgi:hypothetical protein
MTVPPGGRAAGVENPAAGVENPHAGEGPVLLDIGGDVGALVVRMPPDTVGMEVEIRPVSPAVERKANRSAWQGTEAGGAPARGHRHVAVVARRMASGIAHLLVYEGLEAGRYELYPLPSGPVTLTVAVAGGGVTRADWPT